LPNFGYEYPIKNTKLSTHYCIGAVKTGRTTIFTFLALLFIVCLPMQVSAADHQITQWAGNKAAAVSITFDDGHISDYTLAVPALNERGFQGTFFIVTDWIDSATWNEWKDVSNQGHEIASHTKTHAHLTQLSLTEMEEEIGESKVVIDAQIKTQQCLTFSYPYGEYNTNAKTIAEDHYIAARGISCDLNTAPYNFYGMRACSDSRSLGQMKAMTDAAEEQGKWLITYYHSLDGTDYGFWTIDTFIAYLGYLETKDLWVGTFGSVVKYIKERESANLSLHLSSENQIVLSLTDTLDNDIFNEPLTIRSEVPSSWTSVLVQQGASAITVAPVVEGTQTVIYYTGIPDGGLIALKKLTTYHPTITGLSPSSASVGGPSFMLTVYGNNFTNDSMVKWNGSSRSTTYVSGNQLTATIWESDLSVPGTANVTVQNPSSDISNGMNFEVYKPVPILAIQKSGSGKGMITATGINCGIDCTETYPQGTVVTLTASPSTGSTFSSWTGCNSVSGNTCTVNMTANKSVSAAFTLSQYTLTATKTGTGMGTLTASGLSCTGNTCAGIYNYNDMVYINLTADTRSIFDGWIGCDSVTDTVCTILISGDRDVTATLHLEYALVVTHEGTGDGGITSDPSGIDCESTCSDTFVVGTPIRLTAKPYTGSVFAFWSGGCVGTTDTCDLTMTDDIEVAAHFVPYGTKEYNLKVKRVNKNQGDGVVTSNDGNITCGESCSSKYYKDTVVTLSALANDNSVFIGWKPETPTCTGTYPCTVTIDKAKTVQAIFVGDYTLKVVSQSKKGGTGLVSSTPSGISCSPGNKEGCAATYPYAEYVTLSVSPDAGSVFLGWSPANLCPGTGVCIVPMDKKRRVKAVFVGE